MTITYQRHSLLTSTDVGSIVRWEAADAAARLALSLTEADNGRVCLQTDTSALYFLVDYSVPTWIQMSAGAASVTSVAGRTGDVTLSTTDISGGLPLAKLDATTDPAITDDSGDGYGVGSVWVNVTDNTAFVCVDATVGAADWNQIDAAGGGGSGDVVGPASATNDAIAVFDGTTGKLIKNSTGTVAQIAANTAKVSYTDAAKVAGIEAGATADQTGAEIKLAYEAELDTNAYDDAAVTKLAGIEAGADVTDATNVNAAGAVMESDYTPARSLLVQQSGTGSPSVVTLGTDELLGRTTGGGSNIQGLSATAVRTLLNVEDGADVTDTANVTAAGALMDSEVDADLKTFALPANTTISTFGATLVDDADAATARATLGVDGTYLEADGTTRIYHVGEPGGAGFTSISAAMTQVVADGPWSADRAMIYVHPGWYAETSAIDVPNGVIIKGASKGAVRLFNSTTNFFNITGDSVYLEDLVFEGNNDTTLWCIYGNDTDGLHVRRCDLLNNGGTSLQGFLHKEGTTWQVLFVEDCVVDSYKTTGTSIYIHNSGAAARFVDCIINNVFVDSFFGGDCIRFVGVQDARVRNSTVRADAGKCIDLQNGAVTGTPRIKVSNSWLGTYEGGTIGVPLRNEASTFIEVSDTFYSLSDSSIAGTLYDPDHGLQGSGAPGAATGDDYPVGTIYVDTTADEVYFLTDNTTGVNVWSTATGSGGGSAKVALGGGTRFTNQTSDTWSSTVALAPWSTGNSATGYGTGATPTFPRSNGWQIAPFDGTITAATISYIIAGLSDPADGELAIWLAPFTSGSTSLGTLVKVATVSVDAGSIGTAGTNYKATFTPGISVNQGDYIQLFKYTGTVDLAWTAYAAWNVVIEEA